MSSGQVVSALLLAACTASASTPLGPDGASGITAVAVHPQMHTRVYAAAGQPGVSRGEGIYRSDDGGVTWREKDLGLPPGVRNKDIRSIAADGGRNVYAAIFDQGIYRSTDDGEHWTLLGATDSGWALAVDPQTNDLYASIEAAVARFDGKTWRIGQPLPEHPAALAVDPVNGQTLYAMGEYLYGNGAANALYRSTDGAQTWEKVYSSRSVTSLAVSASGAVYIGTNDVHTTVPLLAKSVDHGTTWSDADGDLRSIAILGTTVDGLAVDGATVIAAMVSRIYRSLDQGVHWTKVDDLQEAGEIRPLAAATPGTFLAGVTTSSSSTLGGVLRSGDGGAIWTPSRNGMHQTQARLVLASGSTLFAAVAAGPVDLGLQRSSDGGRTWQRLPSQAQFQNLATSGTTLLGGASTSVQRSSDSGATWSAATGIDCANDIFGLTVDATQSSSVWAEAMTTAEAHIFCLGVYHSTDGGATFTRVTNGLSLVANPFYPPTLGPMAAAGGVGYIWTTTGVYASSDSATWTLRGVPPGAHGYAFAAAGSDLWLLTDAGLQHSTDGARTWQPASPLTTSAQGALAVSGSRVAVTDGIRLFLSNDGSDWGVAGGDLTNIDSLTFDPLGRLMAGTDQGVFLVDVPSHRRVSRP